MSENDPNEVPNEPPNEKSEELVESPHLNEVPGPPEVFIPEQINEQSNDSDSQRAEESNRQSLEGLQPSENLEKSSTDVPKTEGEQEEDEEEENPHKRKKPEIPEIPKDFYYNYEELVSKPIMTEESGLPLDLIKFSHSAGYDCCKRDNLILLTSEILCFIAGNFVEFLNVEDNSFFLLRSLSGDGVGCLTIHPTKKYLAVGEKNNKEAPMIAIYEYPSMQLYRLLRNGTEKAYSYCRFNTSGELLASVGSDPDFMLTVWAWENEQIVLRSKAFSQDVFRVQWSSDLEGMLATCGSGHIKFWKMADTFTGLKLQGHIGKFGKTEISDVEGFVILPDGKVLSGCEWGNLLVWDGDLIKVQIGRKGKKKCHLKEVNQIVIEEGELMTVGNDGWIKTWDFETIDTAEVNEEMALFEMEPMNEVEIAPEAKLMHIVKSTEPESSIWFAQDACGKIWKLDLSFSHTSAPPQCIASYHAGKIMDCDVSPLSYLSASIGNDGSVRIFDFAAKSLIAESQYSSSGSCILWAPIKVDPKAKTVIGGFQDGVVRVMFVTESLVDQNISRKSKFRGELTLIQAFKPHTKRVTALCTDDKGKILITGSEDETVFFFSISTPEYYPVGFVKLAKPIRHIDWRCSDCNDSDADEGIGRVLVYMDEGEVAEIICPMPAKVDHSHTYEIRELAALNTYKFVSVKSRLRHEEELERKRIEEEKRQEELKKIRKDRLERGLETEEEQQKQIDEDRKRLEEEAALEAEWTPFIPESPSPILHGFVDSNSNEKFWLSMGEYDAGYLYQCEFASTDKQTKMRVVDEYNKPVRSIGLTSSDDIPVTCIKWTQSGLRAIMGLQNGSIRLQIVETAFDLSSMTSCWQFTMHDNDYGSVTSICLSHDEKFIISVGNDGNYFIYELMDEQLQKIKIEEYRARLPSASIPSTKEQVDDINDPNAYSIEEHKQKSEYDRKLKMAQEKKAATMKIIVELQKAFKQIKDENMKLPERIRLSDKVFELVPQLREDLEAMKESKINLMHKQMAFDSEKCRLAMEKLKKRFLDPLESDCLEIYAIESDHVVSTIRGCNLSDDYLKVLEELDRIREEMALEKGKSDLIGGDKVVQKFDETDTHGKQEDILAKVKLRGARGMRVKRQLKKLEQNRNKRARRKLEWEKLYAEKPEDDYVDPKDMQAIEEAENNMGDFKLKNSKDYFILEKDRPNTFKSRSELVSMENRIYQYRSAFNLKVKDLKEEKLRIIKEVENTNKVIEEYNESTKAHKKTLLRKISLQPSETPEKKFEYTNESLMEFKKEMEEKKKAALQGDDTKTTFTTFVKPPVTDSASHMAKPNSKPLKSNNPLSQQDDTTAQNAATDSPSSIEGGSHTDSSTNPIFSNSQHVIHLRQELAIDKLINSTKKSIRIFDTKLRLLRHERSQLVLDLQRAHLRQLTVYEEYRLLKMYEKSEFTFAEKARLKLTEKADLTVKLQECQIKIESKKKDIDVLVERDKANFDKFKESLGENNKFSDFLHKVYKKKIKRRKKETEGQDEDSDDSSDSDDSELDESEDNSDEKSEYFDLDMCPPDCAQELYDGTCGLRELRLDIDEQLTEEKRVLDVLRKELDALSKKLKVTESGLIQAKKELEEFQLEKQQKLNQLKTCVILHLIQILYYEEATSISGPGLPKDLDQCLIFEAGNYYALQRRIDELQKENKQQEQSGKEVKARHIKLVQSERLLQKKITETQDECDQMMLTKFGILDNLEKMEQVMINPKIEELTFKIMELQEQMYHEKSHWDDRIRDAQELCIEETKTNTCILNNILTLYNQKEDYEDKLNSTQQDLGSEYQLTGPAAEEELNKLKQLVSIQAQELEALKDEISMLSRKGGHILPPVSSSAVRRGPCDNMQQRNKSNLPDGTMAAWDQSTAGGYYEEEEDDYEEYNGDEDEEEEEEQFPNYAEEGANSNNNNSTEAVEAN